MQEKIDAVLKLEQAVKEADPRVKTVLQCVLASGSGYVRLVNSKGVDCAYRDNLMYSYTAAAVEDGDRSVDGFDIACTREPGGLDMERLARSAVDKALARCGARTVPSGQYPVILEHGAAADLLECFCGMFCAVTPKRGIRGWPDGG